jgi:hypothetical protein
MSKQEMPGIERSDLFNTPAQEELLCVRRQRLCKSSERGEELSMDGKKDAIDSEASSSD